MLKYEENINDYIVKCRRDLHQIPEIGLNLPKTVEYVKNELTKMEIGYTEFKNCTGLSALIGKNKGGKVIALRSDMLYGENSMIILPRDVMGSEDAAYYFEKGCLLLVQGVINFLNRTINPK